MNWSLELRAFAIFQREFASEDTSEAWSRTAAVLLEVLAEACCLSWLVERWTKSIMCRVVI